jgi:hypothetical protein
MGEKQQIGIARGTNILCAKSQKFWRSIRSMHARLHAANKTAKEETMGARSLPAAAGNGMQAGDPPNSHADDDDDADSDRVTTKPDSDGDATRESHFRIHTSTSSSCGSYRVQRRAELMIQQPCQCHCDGQKKNAWTKFNTRLAKRLVDNNVSTSWVHSCRLSLRANLE